MPPRRIRKGEAVEEEEEEEEVEEEEEGGPRPLRWSVRIFEAGRKEG